MDRYDEVNAFVQCEINSELYIASDVPLICYVYLIYRHTHFYWWCSY